MDNKTDYKTSEPADRLSSDIDALRELGATDGRSGWSWQFTIILVLVSAFVLLVWIGVTQKSSGRPVLFAGGVAIAEVQQSHRWVAPAFEQALRATIQSGDQLQIISPESNYYPVSKPVTSARQSGAQWDLQARLIVDKVSSDVVVIELKLIGLGKSRATFASDITGSAYSIEDLATRAVQQVLNWLELERLSPTQLDQAKNEIPSSVASEEYGNGLSALSDGDGRAALEYFETANKASPNNAVIHAGLASAWELLGYTENAIAESKRAVDYSERLTRRRQLEFEARHALLTANWSRAQQVFGALKEFHQDEVAYQLAFAETQARQNDGEGFLQSIKQMRNSQNNSGNDPRIDILEAEYWFAAGDYGKCEQLAQNAKAKAESSGALHTLGEALVSISICDDNYDPTHLLEARDLFKQIGTPVRESEILRELAKHEYGEGNMEQYLAYLQEALVVATRLGNEPEIAASKNSLGQAYDLHGWLNRGYLLKKEVAEYQAQRGNMNRHSIVLENMSISLFKMGRYDEAEEVINRAGKIFREIDDQIGIAWLPYRLGQIALRRGEIDRAQKLMVEALENSKERPEGNLEAEAKHELGLISFYSGDLQQAAEYLEAANKVYHEQGMSASIAESEIALSRVDAQMLSRDEVTRRLGIAAENLHDHAAYFQLSLQTEQLTLDEGSSAAQLRQQCDRLIDASKNQEHKVLLLRAKTKIVLCNALLDNQLYEVSNAMLVAIEQEAIRLGIFEARIAAGYARVVLLEYANRNSQSQEELRKVKNLAVENRWDVRPFPFLLKNYVANE